MKNILGITVFALLGVTVKGQFYYKDILTVQQTNAQRGILKSNRVKASGVKLRGQ